MSEDKLLSDCHLWLRNTYPQTKGLAFHVANERIARNGYEGAKLKSKGVVPGVPDYFFFWGGRVLIIEFKTDKGRLSDNQKDVHLQLNNNGFAVDVVRSLEDFQKIINTFMQ